VGKIVEIHEEDISTWVEIEAASNLMRYIVLKGSVALDGVSLTVAKLGRRSFSVSLIPHTKGETVLNYKKTGELVNIECDLMGKYVERLMGIPDEKVQNKSNLDSEMLKKYGFI